MQKSCMTLGTLYLRNCGAIVYLGHAGFLVSTVFHISWETDFVQPIVVIPCEATFKPHEPKPKLLKAGFIGFTVQGLNSLNGAYVKGLYRGLIKGLLRGTRGV